MLLHDLNETCILCSQIKLLLQLVKTKTLTGLLLVVFLVSSVFLLRSIREPVVNSSAQVNVLLSAKLRMDFKSLSTFFFIVSVSLIGPDRGNMQKQAANLTSKRMISCFSSSLFTFNSYRTNSYNSMDLTSYILLSLHSMTANCTVGYSMPHSAGSCL